MDNLKVLIVQSLRPPYSIAFPAGPSNTHIPIITEILKVIFFIIVPVSGNFKVAIIEFETFP